ncbi:serine hydroxymethyltransferase [Desertimonas flava]|uniref:serine hydroxymethyltransferase n=1 Tax=Desertimonas flava TaxID=2064846 RepID=UPI000E34A0A3|nr:serine hydroxymethyltransferase [Desertimonas flava]
MPFPSDSDPDLEIEGLLAAEFERQTTGIQLIASENFTSPAVIRAMGSVLTNKYSEGYPGKRYYGGNAVIDGVEAVAIERARSLFGAEHANVQPHSGANANMCVYQALLQPGDTVLGLSLDHGGHLTHGSPVNASGLQYHFVAYKVSGGDERIDMDQVRDLALEHRPKLIVAGTTSYPRRLEPEAFRSVADEVGALLMFDAAHIAGLIVGGAHPDPVPHADVVTFTTHKTLRGPRGGAIVCREEHAKAIDKAVFPGWQGGPLEHVIAAKAIAFREAADPAFSKYAHQIVANASALAKALADEGFRLVSGGTDNHMMVVDLRAFDDDLTGKVAQLTLDEAGITLNKNTVPDDPRSPFVTSGLRIGTPSVTTQGMAEGEMSTVAGLIARALRGRDDAGQLAAIREEVRTLVTAFPAYPNGDPHLATAHA